MSRTTIISLLQAARALMLMTNNPLAQDKSSPEKNSKAKNRLSLIDPLNGTLMGASDPRKDGLAIGY